MRPSSRQPGGMAPWHSCMGVVQGISNLPNRGNDESLLWSWGGQLKKLYDLT